MKLIAGSLIALAAAQYDYDFSGKVASDHGTDDTNNGVKCWHTDATDKISDWTSYHSAVTEKDCLGFDKYCYVIERAMFGQTTGIRAGCKQRSAFQAEDWDAINNSDPTWSRGGCAALMLQNGKGALDSTFLEKALNENSSTHKEFMHSSGQDQCLRKTGTTTILDGYSVCHACCQTSSCNKGAAAGDVPLFDGSTWPGTMFE